MQNSPTTERRIKAARLLTEPKLDSLLITSLYNVRYLTGFTGSNAALLLDADGNATLFTDPRYTVQAGQQTDCPVKIAKGTLIKAVMEAIRDGKFRRIGFEQDHVSVSQFEGFKKELPVKAELVPVSGYIEGLRMIKDAGEIDLIRASVNANSQALTEALKHLKIGMTEAEFSAEIDYQNRKLGAEAPAFDTIVAAGVRGALPHAQPGETKIGRGAVLVDMGAFRQGYASDMTRVIHIGQVRGRYRAAYKAVLEAQEAAIDAVSSGVRTAAVDRTVHEILKAHSLDKQFTHSTGHGLGLEIHESPRIGRKDKSKLATGMTITIEPGIYIEGWGGIRIEDTVLVTEHACEILTPTSKVLREIYL